MVTFTTSNWDTMQEIRITAAHDADSQNETVQISHIASGTYADLSIDSLTVQIKDDEALVRAHPLTLSLHEGQSDNATYTLRLNAWPQSAGTYTVHIEAGPKVQTVPDEVQFTQSNWNQRPDGTSLQNRRGRMPTRSTIASRSGTSQAKATRSAQSR